MLSLVIPVRDEESAIPAVAAEIGRAMQAAGLDWEALWIDDGSSDGSRELLAALPSPHRLLVFSAAAGKSAAYASGFAHARGGWIATLDGDGQDDPADIAVLLALVRDGGADLAIGMRTRRQDALLRRLSSRISNRVRALVTRDPFRDVGCAVRVGRREAFQELPFFEGMHRFLPILVRMRGHRVVQAAVRHRPRQGGRSKYGIANRLWCGWRDLWGVRWLQDRQRQWIVREP
jgi:dolichol-phosphate mannosyltransferase